MSRLIIKGHSGPRNRIRPVGSLLRKPIHLSGHSQHLTNLLAGKSYTVLPDPCGDGRNVFSCVRLFPTGYTRDLPCFRGNAITTERAGYTDRQRVLGAFRSQYPEGARY